MQAPPCPWQWTRPGAASLPNMGLSPSPSPQSRVCIMQSCAEPSRSRQGDATCPSDASWHNQPQTNCLSSAASCGSLPARLWRRWMRARASATSASHSACSAATRRLALARRLARADSRSWGWAAGRPKQQVECLLVQWRGRAARTCVCVCGCGFDAVECTWAVTSQATAASKQQAGWHVPADRQHSSLSAAAHLLDGVHLGVALRVVVPHGAQLRVKPGRLERGVYVSMWDGTEASAQCRGHQVMSKPPVQPAAGPSRAERSGPHLWPTPLLAAKTASTQRAPVPERLHRRDAVLQVARDALQPPAGGRRQLLLLRLEGRPQV